jgi:glycosyltransferase involved in cell wall biosynthesis
MWRISVIIPCYNCAAYLPDSITSILDQTFPVDEIIIIDDGSSDNPVSVIHSYKNDKIRLFSQINQGPSRARNYGLAMATGELIGFLDADDRWHRDFISKMASSLQEDPSITVVGCGINYFRNDTDLIEPGIIPRVPNSTADILERNLFPISASLYRRQRLVEAGGFDETLKGVEDWEILIRLYHKQHGIKILPERLIDYRITPDSLSKQVEIMEENSIRMIDSFYAKIPASDPLVRDYDRFRSLRLIDSATGYLRNNNTDKAIEKLRAAVSGWPPLCYDQHFYYAIVCASQPLQYQVSVKLLDLSQGAERAIEVIDHLDLDRIEKKRRAVAVLYVVLAKLAYAQENRSLSIQYWMEAFRNHNRSALDHEIHINLMKAIVGRKNIRKLAEIAHAMSKGSTKFLRSNLFSIS